MWAYARAACWSVGSQLSKIQQLMPLMKDAVLQMPIRLVMVESQFLCFPSFDTVWETSRPSSFFLLLRSEEKGPGWTNMLGSGCRTPGEHWSRSFERLEKRDQRIAIEVGFRDPSHRAGRLAKQEGLQVGIEVPVCAETMPARMAEKAKMAERMVDCSPFPAEAILAVYAMSTDESVSEKQVNKDEGNGQEEKQIARTRTKDLIRPKVRYRTGAVRPSSRLQSPESRVHGQS